MKSSILILAIMMSLSPALFAADSKPNAEPENYSDRGDLSHGLTAEASTAGRACTECSIDKPRSNVDRNSKTTPDRAAQVKKTSQSKEAQ